MMKWWWILKELRIAPAPCPLPALTLSLPRAPLPVHLFFSLSVPHPPRCPRTDPRLPDSFTPPHTTGRPSRTLPWASPALLPSANCSPPRIP